MRLHANYLATHIPRLMRNRTMCLVFVMDCRFVMFYNNPPYLNPLELQFDLPAGDEGIDIADDKSWEPWALDQRSHGRPPSMNELMQALMCNQWTGPGDPQFGNLSIFNMLLLMLGEIYSEHIQMKTNRSQRISFYNIRNTQ